MDSRKNFTNWVYRFGITSSIILFVLMVLFPVTVSAVYGVWPKFSQIWPACIALFLMMIPWFPGESFGCMPIMGPGALYLSYVTGNVTNLRMPVTIGTMNALGLEANTDECHTMSIIACGASNITTVVVLFFGMLLAVPLSPVLNNEALQPAFNYALPALFGGLIAQTILKRGKQTALFMIPLAVCLFFCYFTQVNSAYYMLITVAVSALVFYLFDYKNEKKPAAENAEAAEATEDSEK